MMGAVADGARAGGAHTLGVIPQSLVDLEVADTSADELIVTADMGARKNLMIDRSDAFITLPGGLGTLDELFEVWTTATLDLHRKPIVLLDPDGFYDGLLAGSASWPTPSSSAARPWSRSPSSRRSPPPRHPRARHRLTSRPGRMSSASTPAVITRRLAPAFLRRLHPMTR